MKNKVFLLVVASILLASPTLKASSEENPSMQNKTRANIETEVMPPKQDSIKKYNEACSFCYHKYGRKQQIQLGSRWSMWWRLVMNGGPFSSRDISASLAGRVMTCDEIHDYIEGVKQTQILKEFAGNIFIGPKYPGVVFVNLNNDHSITVGIHKNSKGDGVPFAQLNIYTGPDLNLMQAVLAGAKRFN